MNNREIEKEKIRERYKGISSDELDIIPAIPEENLFENCTEKRVAVYVRVSTDDPRQTSSYELQKNHYLDIINQHPGWSLFKIYADEGISGTSLNHRQAFLEMINDCMEHKFDLIVTKSVSRFARNLLDCVSHVRKLSELQPPVGIFFEAENLYTLDSRSEMALAIIAALAQEESHNKSEIMNASIEMRFRRGIFLKPPLLGYDKDEDGNLVINENEASIIRLIFFMYLYGYTCHQIADTLTNLGCKTKKNNIVWSPSSILGILRNERHCGEVLARKTWTPNYLDHKSKKNKYNRNQYRHKNDHEAIISREDFIAVQQFINNAKYGNKRLLPELKVITQGVLSGFVTIHPHWAGFKARDYILASESIASTEKQEYDEYNIELSNGEFDFRGYEIARSQFFNTSGKVFMTVSNRNISFSSACINKFKDTEYIEVLISPRKRLFAVRSSYRDKNLSVKWSKKINGVTVARTISGVAFLNTIYEILGWDLDYKYRIQGTYYSYDTKSVIIFDTNDTEILIPNNSIENDADSATENMSPLSVTGKRIVAYPTEWINEFGYDFYTHAQAKEIENFMNSGVWDISNEGESFIDNAINIPTKEEIAKNMSEEMEKIRRKNING